MQVTVKTLDSETRTFAVPDESTVEEFKTQIADAVGISADLQRLIFKGKVLQDDTKLKDYEVDGCVVHLVERRRRRPEGANAASSSSAQSGAQTSTTSANVVMGALNLPEVMGISQHIVQGLVSHLGLDSTHANVSTSESTDGSTLNVHINLLASPPEANDVASRVSRGRQFIRAARSSLNRTEGEGILPETTPMDTSSPASEPGDGSTGDQPSQNDESQQNFEQPRPSVLAEVLGELQELSTSLQPVLSRYATLLTSGNTENLLPSDDSLPDRVAETLHNLSHAFHALSDLTFNIRAPEPRSLNILPPLSPHVGTPPATSSFRIGASSGANANAPRSSAETNPQPPPQGSSATQVHINPQASTIAFTSIISSAIPHLVTSQPTGPGTQPSRSAPEVNTGTTTTDPTTSGSTTGTTSSTTGGTANQRDEARLLMDDFVALMSNFSQTTPSHSQTSQTTTPTPPQESSQSGTRSRIPNIGGMRVNRPQVHRRSVSIPDPSLPCESFHFGPRSQRSTPQRTQQSGSQRSGQMGAGGQGIPQAVSEMLASVMQGAMANGAMQSNAQSQQQRRTANAGTNTTTSATSSTQTSSPAADSIMQSLMRLLSNQQGDGAAQTQPPTASGGSQAGGASQQQEGNAVPHALRDAVMRDLVLDAYTHVTRGDPQTGPYQTINDVILELQNRGLDTSSEPIAVEGALLSQLITRIGTSLSIQDTLGIMMGMTQPCVRLRDLLRAYLLTDLLLGDEPTDDNIKRVSAEFVSQVLGEIGSTVTSEQARDDIDVLETVRKFLEYYTVMSFNTIRDTDEPTFCTRFPALMRDINGEFIILLTMCYQNGMQDVQHIITNRLPGTSVAHDLGPAMVHTFHETVSRFVRDTCAQRTFAQETLQQFIVRTTDPKPAEPAPPASEPAQDLHGVENVENTSQHSDDSDTFHTPPGSVGTNDLDVNRQAEDQGEVGMEVDEGDIEDDWKAVVPEDWVPIITQDVVRQRRVQHQQPFSDAYLSGLPPKRRKTADERAVCPTRETVPAIIRQAILATGTTPRTSIDAVTSAARQNTELHDAYRDEIQIAARRRTDTDTDYTPERFPNTREYVKKSQRKQ